LLPQPLDIGAVLLAAGCGQRMGRRPKSLLELDGLPLIRRQWQALSAAGIGEIVVVLGHHADVIAPALAGCRVVLVRNPNPDDGPVSSQRLGLAALGVGLDAVIVALADQPLIGAPEIAALLDAFQARPAGSEVVYPQVGGERGNPVIFSADVRARILAGSTRFGCRQWQSANPQAVSPFVTSNRHYRIDLDTPDDLVRLQRDTGHTLRWPDGLAAATPARR
jgi:CTP:molybdopterin cytidylyltransferase MocA